MKPDLGFYGSIFLRRSPYFLAVALLVSAIGITIALTLPTVYRADALLLVEGKQVDTDPNARRNAPDTSDQTLQIIRQRLTTRDNLLDLADEANIYPNRSEMDPTSIVADMRNRVVIRQSSTRGGQVPTVTVAFEAATASKAAEVANELVTLILAENKEIRGDRTQANLVFFENEKERLETDLANQGRLILEFKNANQAELPDSLEFRRSQQAQISEQLSLLRRQEAGLIDRRARLVELRDSGAVAPQASNMTPAQQQLQRLQQDLEVAKTVYSEANPRIKLLQSRIASQQAVVAAESGAEPDAPVLSPFDIQLADIDAQLAFLAERKIELEVRVAELTTSIDATPAVTIQLSELERNYRNTERQYNEAVAGLADAKQKDIVEGYELGGRISVIEQAVVPRDPARPNRPMIAAASVGGGIALGLAVIFLLEFLNSSIRRPVEITNKLGITPLVTLPYVRTRREQFIRRSAIGGVLLVAVVGVPATLWALHTYYLPMDLLVERAIAKTGLSPVLDQILGRS